MRRVAKKTISSKKCIWFLLCPTKLTHIIPHSPYSPFTGLRYTGALLQ